MTPEVLSWETYVSFLLLSFCSVVNGSLPRTSRWEPMSAAGIFLSKRQRPGIYEACLCAFSAPGPGKTAVGELCKAGFAAVFRFSIQRMSTMKFLLARIVVSAIFAAGMLFHANLKSTLEGESPYWSYSGTAEPQH
jgi:hypothetical protein